MAKQLIQPYFRLLKHNVEPYHTKYQQQETANLSAHSCVHCTDCT